MPDLHNVSKEFIDWFNELQTMEPLINGDWYSIILGWDQHKEGCISGFSRRIFPKPTLKTLVEPTRIGQQLEFHNVEPIQTTLNKADISWDYLLFCGNLLVAYDKGVATTSYGSITLSFDTNYIVEMLLNV